MGTHRTTMGSMSKPALAATAACALAILALSYNQAPALSRGVTARSANNLRTVAANQLKGVNPATLAKVGKAVTQLVGPNASPAQYKQLANEVACATAIQGKNNFLRDAACANVEWYGPNRQNWYPGGKDVVPPHLKGELPGDFGFDPWNLGEDDLSKMGYPIDAKWWNPGKQLLEGKPIDYLGNPNFVHASNIAAIFVAQFFLMAGAEIYRGYYESEEGSQGMYPGGMFDPLKLAKDPKKMQELKVKEIKNGRVAMLAMLGFYVQGFSTGKSPLDNLNDHLADPFQRTRSYLLQLNIESRDELSCFCENVVELDQ